MAGRAHDSLFIAVANGSNQVLGLDNVFIITSLKQTGPELLRDRLVPLTRGSRCAALRRRLKLARPFELA
jgi:hypothetical protein